MAEQPYHKYVFDTQNSRFVGRFEEMYANEDKEGYDSWHQDDISNLEAQISLEEVWSRLPEYAIDEAGLVRVHSTNVRGFSAMPLKFPAARRLGVASPQAGALG